MKYLNFLLITFLVSCTSTTPIVTHAPNGAWVVKLSVFDITRRSLSKPLMCAAAREAHFRGCPAFSNSYVVDGLTNDLHVFRCGGPNQTSNILAGCGRF